MKRRILTMLAAVTLTLSSCTDLFQPSVDYGDQTYINDYSELVAAVNDLNKSLNARFDALNALLDNGMASLRLAVDENTGAIRVLDQTMGSGLSAINTQLFNGFTSLRESQDLLGHDIIVAENKNGELLRLTLDKLGDLLAAEMEKTEADLAATINNLSAKLSDRFDALTLAIQAGLAEVSVKVDTQTGVITAKADKVDSTLGTSLSTLNQTLFNGFTVLNTTITEGNDKIILAQNKNHELLRLQIDASGRLIAAEIQAAAAQLAAVVNSSTATLAKRLEALTTMVQAGFAQVSVGTAGNMDKVVLAINGVSDEVKNMDIALNADLLNVHTDEQKIITAIGSLGEVVKLAISDNGTLISGAVTGSAATLATAIGEIKTQLASNNTSMETKLDAITTALNTGLADVKAELVNGTAELKLIVKGDADLATKLGEIKTSIESGNTATARDLGTLANNLSALNTTVSTGFTSVVSKMGDNMLAFNNNHDALITKIGDNGSLLKTELVNIQDLQKKNTTAVNTFTTGFNNFSTSCLSNQTSAKTALDNLNTAVTTTNTNLSTANQILTLSIDKDSGYLKSALADMKGEVETVNAKLVTDNQSVAEIQAAIKTTLTQLKTQDKTENDAEIKILNGILNSNNTGVYSENGKTYMTPAVLAAIEAAGPSTSVYGAFKNQVNSQPPTPHNKQVCINSSLARDDHTCGQPQNPSSGTHVILAGNMQQKVVSTGGAPVTVVEVVNMPQTYTFYSNLSGCSYPILASIMIKDAKGIDAGNYGGFRCEKGITISNPQGYLNNSSYCPDAQAIRDQNYGNGQNNALTVYVYSNGVIASEFWTVVFSHD